ncbi:HEAT repeat domain-containing protein [Enhygromyxa salina]|uniref:HEAT repeat domain-containing protein n=1 Tax=Enhygromyxa salina TaxID=215803 RepID=UPI0011B29709|nr:HEAT repeat domain-containing protein [Enhygromyxa salina]
MLTVALALQLFAPPQVSAPEESPPAAAPVSDTYDLDAATADVEVILVDRGKAYLDARARLEDHPALAAEAVVARLERVPAPGPEKRDRLLNVLAALKRPEHVGMFGEQLRAAMLHERPTELWIQLLRQQGAAATPVLIGLVGDRELSNQQRGLLLEALVELTQREALGELMAMVGRGAAELQDTLRRALIRRAREHSPDRAAIAAGIDEDLEADADDESRLAQLLILRAACCDLDEAFSGRLEALAGDPSSPFQVRVAAIDGLGRLGLGADVLGAVVREQSEAALGGSQAGEVLVSLALEAMPGDEASTLVSELSLTTAEAPRLAQLGYRHAELAADHSWLAGSQAHPWPEVRKAALSRVAERGSCDKSTVRALAKISGPVSESGEADTRVGRAAVGALGRCADPSALEALRELVEDTGVDLSQRGEAARQLVEHDSAGTDYVAELLVDGRYPDLARELAIALGHADAPSEAVRDALCRISRANPMVASTARESLSKLFPGQSCR